MATLNVPLDCFVSLISADTGLEVVGVGYVRQPALFIYCADGTTIANTETLVWPEAGSDWGRVDEIALWDAPTGGDLVPSSADFGTTETVWVSQYSVARLRTAAITSVMGNAPRPYGVGSFGTGRWGTWATLVPVANVLLEVTFGRPDHACEPGDWTLVRQPEAGFSSPSHVCEPGIWAQGPFS